MFNKIEINRRGFLKYLATAAGAAALPKFSFMEGQSPYHTAVLLPEEGLSVKAITGLNEGLQAGFLDRGLSFAVIPYGKETGTLMEVVKTVLPHVSTVVVFAAYDKAARVSALMEQAGKHLVVMNLGENIMETNSPFMHGVDLGLSRAAFYLGQWAFRQFGGRCTAALEPENSGYDYVSAFFEGFLKAGGSVPTYRFVQKRSDLFDLETGADFIFQNLFSDLGLFNPISTPVVSVTAGLYGEDAPYTVNTWGAQSPLFSLGMEAVRVSAFLLEGSCTSTESKPNCLYTTETRQTYRFTEIARAGQALAKAAEAAPDWVALAGLWGQRSRVSTTLFI